MEIGEGGIVLFGTRLKELRQRKQLTQEETAKLLNISRGTYAHYEIDKRQPDFATLQKLADFFDVSIDYLLGRVNDPDQLPQFLRDPSVDISAYEGYQELSPKEQEIVKEQVRHTIKILKELKDKK
ncbi:helix-turn-helix transcriptional regulator [Aneurinibacillus aneurinilyticus]|uniref:helix-turn-helix domain-containing protein n=1 Tax=Aneurinibacillus aneurinilyticus TaxID=1391 RepID=UPI002E219E47